MKKIVCMALMTVLSSTALLAQTTQTPADKPFRISGQVKGIRDSVMVLAHWYRSATQYIPKDTAKVDAQGRFVFEGAKALPQGLYLVLTQKQRYMEFVVDGQQNFSFVTDTTAGFIKNMKVTGSTENEKFYQYRQDLGKLVDEAQAIELQKKLRNDAVSNAMFQKQLGDLGKKAGQLRKDFIAQNKDLFAAKILSASSEPELPEPPKAANGRPDSLWTFNYYKAHYWDNLDLTDERFLLTPLFQPKLERYIKELTVQQNDSLIKEAELLVEKTKANKEMNLYVIYWITSEYERPKVLGTDGVFIHMAEKYYLTGIMPLSDADALAKVKEKVETQKPLLVGKILPPLSVSDTLQRPINYANIKSDYLVVFLYDPDCGHCRKAAPELKKYTDGLSRKEVEVLAIPVSNSPEKWKSFIKEFGLHKWINGYDYTFRTDYRHQYDVFTTPVVYVLDKDRKIIARPPIPAEQVGDFLEFWKRQQAAKAPATAAKSK